MCFDLFQLFFHYLEKAYSAFMMGQELDELGEFDNELNDNISKFKILLTTCVQVVDVLSVHSN